MATTKTTKKKPVPAPEVEALSDVLIVDNENTMPDLSKMSASPASISDTALINVKSNVFGELIYIDKLTDERVSWPQCGAIQPLTMGMLRRMKNTASTFFSNQLIIITGFADDNANTIEAADIYKSLFISQYYTDILDPGDFGAICGWTPVEIKEKVSLYSASTRQKLVVALNTYIEKGILDSLKAIRTFEEVLGCELARPE